MARRLVLKMSMSVDGYVAGPDGDVGWMARTRSADGASWVEETLWQAGAHLVGRRTHESWARYWPDAPGPMAAPMNTIPKIVFSRSGRAPGSGTAPDTTGAGVERPITDAVAGWRDAPVLGGDLTAQIGALKEQPGKDLLAQGGASFARSLVRRGLVDEYRLVIHPVVLGAGLPLFEGADPFDLTLVGATTFDSGTQVLVYRPGA